MARLDDPAVESHLAFARSTPDYLARRSTRELQAIFRTAPTRPLEALLNTGGVRVDAAIGRIWRDSFWKGTFARDRPLGWDERWLSPGDPGGVPYTGGRFWKRFDSIDHGVLRGLVVNYNIEALPGRPDVRAVSYPDDARRYVAAGDTVLLLRYLNPPYRAIYDTIKVLAPDTAIGIMHAGVFPRGLEIATFVLSRNNYPFAQMAVPDHDALFDDAAVSRVPALAELAGAWRGRLVFAREPQRAMHNQFNPSAAGARFDPDHAGAATIHVWWRGRQGVPVAAADALRVTDDRGRDDLRAIGTRTLIGRRYGRNASGMPQARYVLTRATIA